MRHMNLVAMLLISVVLAAAAEAWNKPGHMLSASIAYQILRQESPGTVNNVRTVLTAHPWFTSRWQTRLNQVAASEQDQLLFMTAARWADDARGTSFHRGTWHYVNLPFKPAGEPDHVQTDPAKSPNILTALAAAENIVRTDSDQSRRAVALAWIFHLLGDVHQPLHTTTLFTHEYPAGDRGGNEICIKPSAAARPIDMHRFWDNAITTTSNIARLRNEATSLRNRSDFARNQLSELADSGYDRWARESFEIAVKIAYQKGNIPGAPKGSSKECAYVSDVKVLPSGYAQTAGNISKRRIMVAAYRLADVLKQF